MKASSRCPLSASGGHTWKGPDDEGVWRCYNGCPAILNPGDTTFEADPIDRMARRSSALLTARDVLRGNFVTPKAAEVIELAEWILAEED